MEDNIELVIEPVPQPLCSGSSPITLVANMDGGIWSGDGIIDEENGIFDPGNVPPNNNYEIIYTVPGAVCVAETSIILNVVSSPTVTLANALLCEDSPSIQLEADPFDQTGVFTGAGIQDSIQGVFDPTTVAPDSTYIISYTYTDANNCEVVTTSEVQVEAFPIQNFNPAIELCLSDITVDLSELVNYSVNPDGGTSTWSGQGIVDAAQGLFNPIQEGLGVGTHQIIISYERNECFIQDTLEIELISSRNFSP